MHSKKTLQLKMSIALIATGLFWNAAALAAPSCSSFLEGADKQEPNNPIEAVQQKLDAAKTLDDARELTYEKVEIANLIFDQAIDAIIKINQNPSPDPQIAQQQALEVQAMFDALQNGFGISSFVMNFAVSNRLQIESAEYNQMIVADKERRAAGFNRDESAQSFNTEADQKLPLGFELSSNKPTKKSFSLLFFEQFIQTVNADKSENENTQQPTGFKPPKNDLDDEKPLKSVGFITLSENKSFEQSDLPEVVLNIKHGEFRVKNDPTRQPAGFN